MAQQQFPSVGAYDRDHDQLLRRIVNNLEIIMQGKMNNTGEFTVDSGTAKTNVTLSKGKLTNTTVIPLMPTTANAASEVGAGAVYVSTINASDSASGSVPAYSFEVTHGNNAGGDRTYKFILIG